MDYSPNKLKEFYMFWKTFKKFVLFMIIEDLSFYACGKAGLPVVLIIPVIIVIAFLFTYWMVKRG